MRLSLSVAFVLVLAASGVRADSKPVAIDGLVQQPQRVSADTLRRLPSVERQVTFQTDHGTRTATYTGVLLRTVIERAPVSGEMGRAPSCARGDGGR